MFEEAASGMEWRLAWFGGGKSEVAVDQGEEEKRGRLGGAEQQEEGRREEDDAAGGCRWIGREEGEGNEMRRAAATRSTDTGCK